LNGSVKTFKWWIEDTLFIRSCQVKTQIVWPWTIHLSRDRQNLLSCLSHSPFISVMYDFLILLNLFSSICHSWR
jgi:hypothetical protein